MHYVLKLGDDYVSNNEYGHDSFSLTTDQWRADRYGTRDDAEWEIEMRWVYGVAPRVVKVTSSYDKLEPLCDWLLNIEDVVYAVECCRGGGPSWVDLAGSLALVVPKPSCDSF